MKKYTIDEILKMDNCDDIEYCDQCPFLLKETKEKYYFKCKAFVHCRKNKINFNFIDNHPSSIYIQHLKEQKLLLQDIMDL